MFCGIDQLILKFVWKCKEANIVKKILKKNKGGRFTHSISRLTKAKIIKTMWYWHKNKNL